MVTEIVDIIHLTLSGLSCLSTLALLIWGIFELREHGHKRYFVKRRLSLVSINLGCLFVFSINQNLHDPILILQGGKRDSLLSSCFYHGFNFSMYFYVQTYLIRVWLFICDMELSQVLKNSTWQMAIDPSAVSKNWFLDPKNQRRWGNNGKYLVIIASISSAIMSSSQAIARAYDHKLSHVIFVIIALTLSFAVILVKLLLNLLL